MIFSQGGARRREVHLTMPTWYKANDANAHAHRLCSEPREGVGEVTNDASATYVSSLFPRCGIWPVKQCNMSHTVCRDVDGEPQVFIDPHPAHVVSVFCTADIHSLVRSECLSQKVRSAPATWYGCHQHGAKPTYSFFRTLRSTFARQCYPHFDEY